MYNRHECLTSNGNSFKFYTNGKRKKARTNVTYATLCPCGLNINNSTCAFLKSKFSDQTSVPVLQLLTHIRTKFLGVDFKHFAAAPDIFCAQVLFPKTCKYFTLGVCPIVVLWPRRIRIHFLGKSSSLITTFAHFSFHDTNKERTVRSIYNVIKWC